MSDTPTAEPEVTREQYEAAREARRQAQKTIDLFEWQRAERIFAGRLHPAGVGVLHRVVGALPALVLLSLLALLAGCSTVVYGPGGQPQMRTYANATRISFTGPGTSFSADRLDHSTPTRAAGSVIGTATSGIGSVITAAGAAGVLK